jgi:hypothetical protein
MRKPMARLRIPLFTGVVLVVSQVLGGDVPRSPAPEDSGIAVKVPGAGLPVGKWTVEFANGVTEACEIGKDGTASVAEPLRSSTGKAEIKDGSVVIVFQDDRIEKWTPVGKRFVVEHWPASVLFPYGTPVLGIGTVAGIKGLEMSLRLDRETYRFDEPITLELIIKNIGAEKIYLGMSATDMSSFDFVVNYVGGGMTQFGRMSLTNYGTKLLQELPASKNIAIWLKPGEQRSYRFALNRMVDMTLSGTYSVVLKRTVPAQPTQDAEGNKLTGTLLPNVLISNKLSVGISELPTR